MPGQEIPLILVVDDDVTALLVLTSILRKAGFRVNCASTLEEGREATRTGKCDLILLDMHLPDGKGVDLCRLLKTQPATAQTPVIFISADSEMNTKLSGFEVGGADYITKPYATAEVLARVHTHLRMKAAYESLALMQADRIKRLATAQKTIMPKPEDLPVARFAVTMMPFHEAGGDFYDVIPVGEKVVDYIVADASGHDLDSSFWTAAIKALLHEYATSLNSPADILQSLNGSLFHILPGGSFFTIVYARLNRRDGLLRIANAGHPPAVLVSADSRASTIEQTGDVAGAFKDAAFGETSRTLRPGDRLFLYSDGLVEVGDTRECGIKNLTHACELFRRSSLTSMVESVTGKIRAESIINDDIVLMGIEI